MKFFTVRKLFQYFLPVTLTLFMIVTVQRFVTTDIGGYDRLYGLPLSFISSNYAFTHHYDIYLLAMFFDLLVYFTLTVLLFKLIEKSGITLKTHWPFIGPNQDALQHLYFYLALLSWLCFN